MVAVDHWWVGKQRYREARETGRLTETCASWPLTTRIRKSMLLMLTSDFGRFFLRRKKQAKSSPRPAISQARFAVEELAKQEFAELNAHISSLQQQSPPLRD